MAIILMVIGLFNLLEGFGISQAVIQRDEVSAQESSSLFYFNVLLCLLLAGLLYLISPLIGAFFSVPELTEYLRLACVIVVLTGPSLLCRAFLEKYLHFKHLSLTDILRNLVILGATTLFLVKGLGVPGVIYAQIMGVAFTTLATLGLSIRLGVAPVSLFFSPLKLIPFLRFGIFVSAKQLMTFAAHRMDEVIIGYFLTPEILGIYHFGKNLLERIRTLMTMSFGKVLFPIMSQLKHQPEKLTSAYHRISHFIAFAAFPVFAGIAVTAHLFVPLIFGEQWAPSVIVFQVFSIAVILLALTANVSSSLLYSVNKPDEVFYIDVVTNTLYFTSLLVATIHGMIAVLQAYSFYVLYKTLTLQYFANRRLTDGFRAYFRQLTKPGTSALVMVAAVLSFQFATSPFLGETAQLAGSMTIGLLVYSSMSWLLSRDTLFQLRAALAGGEISK